MVLEAEGYKQEVINRAQGEASRFLAIYNEYKQSRDVTKKRMYLETMERLFSGTDKIILDSGVGQGGSGVVPYLPLNELSTRRPQTGGGQ